MGQFQVRSINNETTKDEIVAQFNGLGGSVYFIYSGDKKLHDFITDLDLSDKINLRLNIAKEKEFGYDVHIGGAVVKSLRELVENINAQNDEVILDTDDKNEIADLTQQLIYLGLRLNLYLKGEKVNRARYQRLNEVSDALYQKTIALQEYLKTFNLAEKDLKDFVEQLDLSMGKIGKALKDTQRRELILSVMGTKKCGKSMVINSFLGNEYAPTSLELPTPNTIVYQKSEDNNIWLDFKGQKSQFDNASEINDSLHKLFSDANKAESASDKTLQDMTIYYDASNTDLANMHLKIADTPGPNLAGADHSDVAVKWIEASDVILYVIDYEKHATKDEISFLEQIKTQFEKLDKFYSLVILINKTDKVFETKENKSLVRVASFIRDKIVQLGFKSPIVIPTISKAYFYSDIAKEYVPTLTYDDLKMAKKKLSEDRNKIEIINFINTIVENLDDNGIDRSYEAITKFSNFDYVKNYSFYIAQGKALDELVQSAMSRIESEMNVIANDYASIDLIKNMGDKKDKIKAIIEELNDSINKVIAELAIDKIFDGMPEQIVKDYDVSDKLNGVASDFIQDAELMLDGVLNNERELERIYESDSAAIQKDLQRSFEQNISKLGLEHIGHGISSQLANSIASSIKQKEKAINEWQAKINHLIDTANEELKKEYEDFCAFESNKIDFAFYKSEVLNISSTALKMKIMVPSLNVEKDGYFKRGWNWFTSDSDYHLKNQNEVINGLKEYVGNVIKAASKDINIQIKENIKSRLDETRKIVKEQFDAYSKNLSPVTSAIGDLNKDVGLIEAKMDIINKFIHQEAYRYLSEQYTELKNGDLTSKAEVQNDS